MCCSNDVIPGCSQRGLSPIRFDQAAPQTPLHAAPLQQHDVNHQWTADSICGRFVCVVRKQGGWRTQTWVHLRAKSNHFGIKNILIFLNLHLRRAVKTFFCSSLFLNLINFVLYVDKKAMAHLIFGGYLGCARHSISWVKGEQTWLCS